MSDQTLTRTLTGHRMIERFTVRGILLLADKSEICCATALLWWGVMLCAREIPLDAAGTAIAGSGGSFLWGLPALISGVVQIGGLTLVWLGIAPPVKPLRLVALLAATIWWTAMAVIVAMVAPGVAATVLAMAVLSASNYRRVALNGTRWTLH